MRNAVDRALQALGIGNLLLGVHEAALPGLAEEDLGRGSPYSAGAAGFFAFARSLGFTGVQLGPQGITTPGNLSPYDGTWFAKNPLSLAPLPLTRPEYNLLAPEELAALTERLGPVGSRVDERLARPAIDRLTAVLCRRFRRLMAEPTTAFQALRRACEGFRRQNAAWLERDALYEILRTSYGGRLWHQWSLDLDRQLFAPPAAARLAACCRLHSQAIADFSFIQFLLDAQHLDLRELCRGLGLKLFGDCQIGMSDRDAWYAGDFLLPGYLLGAPPSRTHPAGQPWNYPLLDPRRYGAETPGGRQGQPGPAMRFFQARMAKLAGEFDGLRLDHPHGLICPWVYKADERDPFAAVRRGARLFASPALADHPQLAKLAIVRPDQLNERAARFADDWVMDLDPAQLARYTGLFAAAMEAAGAGGIDIACEILSTEPYPVRKVRELYGLGRFRVTQKADLTNGEDGYRSENAKAEDWLMLSTHDTEPIWRAAERWRQAGTARLQAEYLADRLAIPGSERARWIDHLVADAGSLVQAKFADLFLGPARNILVYFTDLLGFQESYNNPGTVGPDNWTLRIPPDYRRSYEARVANGLALHLPSALAMALRAKNDHGRHEPLIAELAEAAHHVPG